MSRNDPSQFDSTDNRERRNKKISDFEPVMDNILTKEEAVLKAKNLHINSKLWGGANNEESKTANSNEISKNMALIGALRALHTECKKLMQQYRETGEKAVYTKIGEKFTLIQNLPSLKGEKFEAALSAYKSPISNRSSFLSSFAAPERSTTPNPNTSTVEFKEPPLSPPKPK